MTDAKRKAKIVLLQRNKTFADLAHESGYALATIHNVLDGKSSSAKSKQAITNILQAEIFPGLVPRPPFTLHAGTEIERSSAAEAQRDAAELGEFAAARGKWVVIVKDTPVVLVDSRSEANSATRKPRR
jgi:hypothetical protein